MKLDDPKFIERSLKRAEAWQPDRSVVFEAVEAGGRAVAELLVRHAASGTCRRTRLIPVC